MHCVVCSVDYILYSVLCSVGSVQSAMWSMLLIMQGVKCAACIVYSVQYSLFFMQCTMCELMCAAFGMQFKLSRSAVLTVQY